MDIIDAAEAYVFVAPSLLNAHNHAHIFWR